MLSYGLPGIAVRAFLHRVRYRQNRELLIQTLPSVPRTLVPATDVAQAAISSISYPSPTS